MRRQKCTCRFLWNYELHGLTQLIIAKTWTSCILWALLTCTCMVLAVFMTYNTFSVYLERQTATLITKHREKKLQFPSIVVCPKNPDSLNIEAVIKDIRRKIPHITRVEAANLISFAIAGSGFHNMETVMIHLTPFHYQRLFAHLKRWKGKRTYKEFYNDLYLKYGYKCEQFFHSCYTGYDKINCCEKFKPQFVMLRGKCFRLQDHYQTYPDVYGRLMLLIKQISSPLAEYRGKQPQVVIFISDRFIDVSTFPRFYVNLSDRLYVRMWTTELKMLPQNKECSTDPKDQGRATCYVEKYHKSRVLGPLNCSLFYLSDRYPNHEVCDALTVVYNYDMVTNTQFSTDTSRCLPACNRFIIRFKFYKADVGSTFKTHNQNLFTLQASYVDLEYDTYTERSVTTPPGFISELGGQSGLFVGFSVISILNVFVSLITYAYKRISERIYRYSN